MLGLFEAGVDDAGVDEAGYVKCSTVLLLVVIKNLKEGTATYEATTSNNKLPSNFVHFPALRANAKFAEAKPKINMKNPVMSTEAARYWRG